MSDPETTWANRAPRPPSAFRRAAFPRAGFITFTLLSLAAGCTDLPGSGGEDPAAAFALVEELRVGALDGPEEEMFGSVTAIAPAADGSFYVLDRQVPAVRRFAADGAPLGTVGREGEGPGEYTQPSGLAPLDDGGVAVWDPGISRLSLFGPDGAYREGFVVPSGLLTGRALETDTLGRFHVRAFIIPEGWAPSPGEDSPPSGWIRVSSSGEVVDTVTRPPEGADRTLFVVQSSDGTLRPFQSRTISALGPGGEPIHARNDTYVVLRGAPGGPVDTLIDHRGRHDPVPLAGEERAQWEAFARYVEERSDAEPFPAMPRTKPALQDLWTDRSGRVWVRRHAEAVRIESSRDPDDDSSGPPPLEFREPPVFDLFSPDGELLGTLEVPRGVRVLAAEGDEVWTLGSGELGETYVVRNRLTERE